MLLKCTWYYFSARLDRDFR